MALYYYLPQIFAVRAMSNGMFALKPYIMMFVVNNTKKSF